MSGIERLGLDEAYDESAPEAIRRSARFGSGALGEGFIEALYERYRGQRPQRRFPAFGGLVRVVDVVSDGVIHEVKVGYVAMTRRVRIQVRKDIWIVEHESDIVGAIWHFLPSARTGRVGPSAPLAAVLLEAGIAVVVHTPLDSRPVAPDRSGA